MGKTTTFSIFSGICLLILFSCDTDRLNFDRGFISIVPTNFSEVNSEYDDYNSDMDWDFARKQFSLVFSSNRNSQGNNFDFISFHCMANSDGITGIFSIDAYEIQNELFAEINSPANELGPLFLIKMGALIGIGIIQKTVIVSFLQLIKKEIFDIQMVNCTSENYDYITESNLNELTELNSAADDAYPTIVYDSLKNTETIYFTSNREGNFDIYSAISNENTQINNSVNVVVNKVEKLCSDSDDKCPYIKGNVMVFSSNRPGGLGGFDLWYSIYNGSEWLEPKNFGSVINTEFDEYRPVISNEEEDALIDNFFNNLMIFSSNRPGGKGGFDLYYVGIAKNLQ